jgi:hypothetical protein
MSSNDWEGARLPTLYVKAQKALAECRSIDECIEWKNRAEALRSYARQINDTTLIEDCNEIRNRANDRAGELLMEEAPAPGARTDLTSCPSGQEVVGGRAAAAEEAGLTPRQAREALQTHKVKKEKPVEFEAKVRKENLGREKSRAPTDFDKWMRAVDEVARGARSGFKRGEVASLLPRAEKALKVLTRAVISMRKAK